MTKPSKSNLTELKRTLKDKIIEALGSVICVDPFPLQGNEKKKEK